MDTNNFFKALADQTRLRCLMLLVDTGELCVCELALALDLPQPKVSHHLAALRKAGLVCDRKEGLWVYYSLSFDLPLWATSLLRTTAKGVAEISPFCDDRLALFKSSKPATNICSA